MIRNLGWALAAAVSLAGIGAASAADMAVKARPLPAPRSITGPAATSVSARAARGSAPAKRFAFRRIGAVTPACVRSISAGARPKPGSPAVRSAATTRPATGCSASKAMPMRSAGALRPTSWSALPAPSFAGDIFDLRQRLAGFGPWPRRLRHEPHPVLRDRRRRLYRRFEPISNWIPIGPVPGTLANDSRTLTGGTVGAGVEHAVDQQLHPRSRRPLHLLRQRSGSMLGRVAGRRPSSARRR